MKTKDRRPIPYKRQMLLNDTDLTKFQLKGICFIAGGSYIKGNLPEDNFDK